MQAKKCDRCGKLYENYNTKNNYNKTNGLMLVNIDSKGDYYSHNRIDLCPDCNEKLIDFLNVKEE